MTSEPAGFDFYAIGEVVIDLISTTMADSLTSAKKFQAFVGGQPTNLAIDLALLGKNTALAACVGNDGFGDLIIQFLKESGVSTDLIQRTDTAPTSISIIARNTKTPDFVIHRGADASLGLNSAQEQEIVKSRIVHSSAFALAREPARSTVMEILKTASENQCVVTFDPNYHPKIWPDTADMVTHLKAVYQFVDITKPSLDDCERIFGNRLSPQEYADLFLDWGPSVVIITMGSEGVFVATSSGERYKIHPKTVDVADVTGAGDAFWAGFLSAHLEGKNHLEAACFGQVVAEAKVGVMGPITDMPTISILKERAKLVEFTSVE